MTEDVHSPEKSSVDTGFRLSTKNIPAPAVRDLPEAPVGWGRIIGPGLVGAGVGLASGEFILWPYIASQVGLIFLWGAVVGVLTQWFLNMEIERYTLATGETALTGFNRMWKHWGLFFAFMAYLSNLWPGWATSSAAMLSYIFGGQPRWIAIAILLVIACILTLAPVVYVALERLITVKVILIGGFFILALALVVKGDTWADLPQAVTNFGRFPQELGFAVMMGAIAYAGAGGGQNLCQSNWIRDKGFGMGHHVPRLTSPITGEKIAVHEPTGFVFSDTEENRRRWQAWWKFANIEQLSTFVLITILTIAATSMLATSTLFGRDDVQNNISFLRTEGQVLQEVVGGWFGVLFWAIGAFSLFAAAAGIVDYTTRLMSDVLKSTYLRKSQIAENKLYFILVWSLCLVGIGVLLLGLDQPLILLVISACTAGVMMFVYSILLLVMNRKTLPPAIRVRSYRIAALVWSAVFFAFMAALALNEQVRKLL
ncbi:MAG: Nramp family divalent metal transporter [Propionibacteriaceae bacterium]|nr:Nramp family divalent metal transporter [Propionibacteriaceae bacterium]